MSEFPYQPGSEVERARLQRQVEADDAKVEAERVASLPPVEAEAPNPASAPISQSERAELEALRAQAANRPYEG